MKKLFGRDKPKDQPLQPLPIPQQQTPLSTPIHQQFSSSNRPQRPSSDSPDQWEVIDPHTPPALPPGASPPVPSPTARSPSPYTISSIPPNANKPLPNQQRQDSPQQTLRKKTPPAMGILQSLEPVQHARTRSEERGLPPSENGHGPLVVMVPTAAPVKEKKGGFWGRSGGDKERDRDRERERDRMQDMVEREMRNEQVRGRERRDEENELTRKIGFLTATASEDWTLVLDVCDHASSSDANAKEAVRALRREFKYGEPAAQLAAARLWAIMLRNSSDVFISQCTSRKFLDTLEDLLTSSRTSPVVRERVMDVLAAAAYASGSKKDSGFRGLWRRVKPKDKPDEGMPFDTEDAMLNPPMSGVRVSAYDYDNNSINMPTPPMVTYQNATPIVPETPPIGKPPGQQRKRKTSDNRDPREREHRPHRDRPRDHSHKIIPPDEDMRRLFQECKIGVGNAALLSNSLAVATPEDLGSDVIKEFHKKCMDSQELIFTQIPWASAGAERSRAAKDQQERDREKDRKRKNSDNALATLMPPDNDSAPDVVQAQTREEELLAELLAANEQLLEALKLYDDLKRVAVEREVEDRSRIEKRMDPRQRQYIMENGEMLQPESMGSGGSPSRSRSPSPGRGATPTPPHPPTHRPVPDMFLPTQTQLGLAPPPAAPHGPRLPGANPSRTPSPGQPADMHATTNAGAELVNGMGSLSVHSREYASYTPNGRPSLDTIGNGRVSYDDPRELDPDDDGAHDDERPMQPSAKALGKRRVVEPEPYDRQSGDEDASMLKDNLDDRLSDSDDEDSPSHIYQHMHHPVQHYVYDAVAERTQQRLREGHQMLVNGVH